MRRCDALWIGSAALGVLRQGVIGEVHSIFERVFNVTTMDNMLISIAKRDVPRNPINIIVDVPSHVRMPSLSIQRGTEVSRFRDLLLIGDKLAVSLGNARVWRPQKGLKETVEVELFKSNLSLVKEFVRDKGNHEGLGQLLPYVDNILSGAPIPGSELNPFSRSVLPRIIGLLKAVRSKNFDGVRKNAKNLVGLGPGLTPSADDMLAGFMVGLRWAASSLEVNEKKVDEVNSSIVACVNKTTLLSQQVLKHSAVGEVNETVENFLKAILMDKASEVKESAGNVLLVGETSGADTMLGILLGLFIALEFDGQNS